MSFNTNYYSDLDQLTPAVKFQYFHRECAGIQTSLTLNNIDSIKQRVNHLFSQITPHDIAEWEAMGLGSSFYELKGYMEELQHAPDATLYQKMALFFGWH